MVDDQLPDLVLPLEGRDHCLGPLGARYSLLEYGDYECPHCADAQPTVKELVRELGDDLCFAFRHFPQPTIHPRSAPAAQAAEAADEQGKFWLMHERLFANRTDLSDAELRTLARGLPLDMATFDRDLLSGAPARRVAADVESGTSLGVVATPTFFVNGRMHAGSHEFVPLLDLLRRGRAP